MSNKSYVLRFVQEKLQRCDMNRIQERTWRNKTFARMLAMLVNTVSHILECTQLLTSQC